MADISRYLADILNAIYGEQVRGSIYNAIDIINKSGEKTLTLGTAVNSPSSSGKGYYENSLYLNTNNWDLWKYNGSSWVRQGNFKGANIASITKAGTSGLVDTYNVNLEGGSVGGTFNVTNGEQVSTTKSDNTVTITTEKKDGTTSSVTVLDGNKFEVGTEVTATNTSTTLSGIKYYDGDLYFNSNTSTLWKCNGTGWENKGSYKGEQGIQGIQGYSISEVTKTSTSGLVDTYTVKNDNNDVVGTFSVTNGEKGDQGDQGVQGYSISEISKTSTSGLIDTYTVKNDNNEVVGTFTVTNGEKGDQGIQGIQGIQGYSIDDVSKSSTSGLVDTYEIKNDNNEVIGTFTVTNGVNLSGLTKVSTLNNVDTYRLDLSDGTSGGTFTVTNGIDVVSITKTGTSGLVDIYSINLSDGASAGYITVTNGSIVSVSKTENRTTIETTNVSGTTSFVIKDGTRIGCGYFPTMSATSSNIIDGITYFQNDLYIETGNYNIWECGGTNTWIQKSNIKGEPGAQMRAYIGSTELSGSTATVSKQYISPDTQITLHDMVLAMSNLQDTSVNSFKIDLWEVTTLTPGSNTVGLTLLTTAYAKTGERGPRGYDISSISLVSKTGRTSTYRVNISDGSSGGTFEVLDGETGPQGVSPIITSSKTGIITTVTVTDASGTHSFEIRDGDSGSGTGDMLKSTYDKNNDGVIDNDNLPIATPTQIRDAIDDVR